jgi:succinyl-CoA synthetase alpha subunit
MVGGVTPGKGGQDVDGIPVFDTVREAVDSTSANATMIFVPAPFTADAILEAVDPVSKRLQQSPKVFRF